MAQGYDLVIRGGTIVDGSGAPSFTGDVAVKDGWIAAVGLPSGGKRLHQLADGYVATFVNGKAIVRNGKPTAERPGKLIRGAQAPRMEMAQAAE